MIGTAWLAGMALLAAPVGAGQVNVAVVQAPAPRVLARVEPNNTIRVLDVQRQADTIVYRGGTRRIRSLKVAPSERFLAFIEEPDPARRGTRADLVVIDPTGRVVHRDVSGVQQFAWCCQEGVLTKVVGEEREGGVGFLPTGTFVLEVERQRERRIPTRAPVHEVAWATHDRAVYVATLYPVDGATVFRFDPRTGRVTPTPYHDIHFSPDGRFYLHFADERDPETRVYETATNREITLPRDLGVPAAWVYDSGSFLRLVQTAKVATGQRTPGGIRRTTSQVVGESVYEVGTRRRVRVIQGPSSTWMAAPNVLPLLERGRLTAVRRPAG